MSAEQSVPWSPARTWLAAGVTAAVLGLAIAAGILATSAAPGPLLFVETLSARISGGLLSLGTKAPLGYAFVAGMVASVNPCGFVLLPAYLGLYLGDDRGTSGGRRPIGRAVVVSVTVTASFVLLFGLAGILTSLAASAVTAALPWIGAAVGAGLILLGGVLASGRELDVPMGWHRSSAPCPSSWAWSGPPSSSTVSPTPWRSSCCSGSAWARCWQSSRSSPPGSGRASSRGCGPWRRTS